MSENGCHGYWHVQISSKKNQFYKLQKKVTILLNSLTFLLKTVIVTGTFSVKRRQKCKIVASKMGVGVINWPLDYSW